MNVSFSFIRLLLLLICVLCSINFTTQTFEGGANLLNLTVGLLSGLAIAGLLIGSDFIFKRFNLKALNTAILGLFLGCLLAQATLMILTGVVNPDSIAFSTIRFFVYLISVYIAMTITEKNAQEFYMSIPFMQFKKMSHKKKDILVDVSVLTDPRIIDLASSGLIDHHLILPRFALKDLYSMAENGDEVSKIKARRSLEVLKKLESIPTLDLRYDDTDFSEIKDPMAKLVQLARFLDTNIITSDINRVQSSSIEGVRIINIHLLSNALKPLTKAGEYVKIKVQRYGKDPGQGVGYLEDGTMVVINGGAEFVDEVIKAQVVSVIHSSGGRMIFCNAAEDSMSLSEFEQQETELESSSSSSHQYFN
jgi:uncharacterized protein YacL